jgi:hypothetical protein
LRDGPVVVAPAAAWSARAPTWRWSCGACWTLDGRPVGNAARFGLPVQLAASWQSVFHFHTHVVPRYRADELQVMWRAAAAADAELAALRARVLAVDPS